MALIEINWTPSQRVLRQFGGMMLPAFCALVGAFVLYKTGSWSITAALWGFGALSAVIGLTRPRLMRPVYALWMGVAFPIGWTVSHVLMAVVYYLIVTPIGLLMRVLRYDPMNRAFDREARTYWVPSSGSENRKRYFRQF